MQKNFKRYLYFFTCHINQYKCIFLATIFLCYCSTTDLIAAECTNPNNWTQYNNTILLNKDAIIGAYIVSIKKIIYIGTIKVNHKREKYMNSFLYETQIMETIKGKLPKGQNVFLLIGALTAGEHAEHIIDEERFASGTEESKQKYMTFITTHNLYDVDKNKETIISKNLTLPSKFTSIISKYTDKFAFIGECSYWSVNDIYKGAQYNVIKYMNEYLASGSGFNQQ